MTAEQAYLLWKTGEIHSPPTEHEEYCRKRAEMDAVHIGLRLVASNGQVDVPSPEANPFPRLAETG